jgi:XTP/dITP diphosphohydrolase
VRVVLASSNAGKLQELSTILAPFQFELVSQSAIGLESPPETGRTFLDNALLKARHAARQSALSALADDSGIEVAALNGRPGVFSARFAREGATDRENLEKLLGELRAVPPEKRHACFRCVICFVRSAEDRNPLVAEGAWQGTIASEPRGSHGFGYDPVFVPEGSDRTAAQLTPDEKNMCSHRGQALRQLLAQLRLLDRE